MEPEAPSQGATFEFCYRHPREQTGVHCTRCGRPICPECMIPAPVGYQCPECVAEARKAFRRSPAQRARAMRRASITSITLGILALIFAIQVVGGQGLGLGLMSGRADPLIVHGAMSPILVARGDYYRLFTAMFLHLSLLHILFNGWALLIFGRFVEQSLGRVAFAVVFLLGGLCGSVGSYLFGPVNELSVGASGAIVALFGAFVAYNYRRRHMAMSRANLQSALIIVLLNLVLTVSVRGIDWRAHLGGLVGGLVLGGILDGVGPARYRTAIRVGGILAVAAGVVALVAIRTAQIHSMSGAQLLG